MNIKFKYKNIGELPIYKFLKFRDITLDNSLTEIQKEIECLSILCDEPVEKMYKLTTEEASKCISIMHKNLEEYKLLNNNFNKPKKIILNDNIYYIDYKLNKINMAQYVDFQLTVTNIEDHYDKIVDILSIFIIPKGYKYGEDYDMEKVKEDIKNITLELATSISFFLKKRSQSLIKDKLFYNRMMMKIMKWTIRDPKLKKEMSETIDQMKTIEEMIKNQ